MLIRKSAIHAVTFSSRRGAVLAKTLSLVLLVTINLMPVSTALAAFGLGDPTIFNPDAFSVDKVASKVDGASGTFTQRLQLDIPTDRSFLAAVCHDVGISLIMHA